MNRWVITASVGLLVVASSPAAPQEAVALALTDAKALDAETAYYTRYLDATHLPPQERIFYARLLTLHLNMLSRSARFYKPRDIAGSQLLAVDLRYLAEDAEDGKRLVAVWERMRDREPYYHQKKLDPISKVSHGFAAEHLDKRQIHPLEKVTQSFIPVVTVDWFFAMTCVEADRGGIGTGVGYYDFIGVKNRDDFFKLVGVNLTEKRSEKSELLAVVLANNSGVAQNDRMIVRRGAVDGFLWFTLDFFDNNLDEHNPLLYLDPKKGLKHQAERHFATLPNGLPAVIACTDQGVLQETAPDKIGPDHSAKGNDARIHSAKSCISCHANGFLKDVNDEVRQVYKFNPDGGYNLLTAATKDEQIRLEEAYLRDMTAKITTDRLAYEQRVKDCVGTTAKEMSSDYREGYEKYILEPLTVDRVAAGIGVPVEEFQAKLKLYRKADQFTSHVVAPLSVGRTVTRQNYEQMYPLLQQVVRGVPLP